MLSILSVDVLPKAGSKVMIKCTLSVFNSDLEFKCGDSFMELMVLVLHSVGFTWQLLVKLNWLLLSKLPG